MSETYGLSLGDEVAARLIGLVRHTFEPWSRARMSGYVADVQLTTRREGRFILDERILNPRSPAKFLKNASPRYETC